MRLTAELISHTAPHVNPLKEWQLELRGCKIPAIENTGVTKDQFDCIDLSDNAIKVLGNFATLKRLVTLLLNNNPVARVAPDLGTQLPKLEMLVLTNARIASLTEIDNLATLKSLLHLSLASNPVQRLPHYRAYVIHKMPWLRSLDFTRIKRKEREAAAGLFATAEGKLLETSVQKSKTFAVGQVVESKREEAPLLPEERAAFEAALAKTTTPEEVDEVEAMLKAGKFRPGASSS